MAQHRAQHGTGCRAWYSSLTCRRCRQPGWGWLQGGRRSLSPGRSLAGPAPSSSQTGEPIRSRALQSNPRSPAPCHPKARGSPIAWTLGLTRHRSRSPAGPPAASAPHWHGRRRAARAPTQGSRGRSAAPPRSLQGPSALYRPQAHPHPALTPNSASTITAQGPREHQALPLTCASASAQGCPSPCPASPGPSGTYLGSPPSPANLPGAHQPPGTPMEPAHPSHTSLPASPRLPIDPDPGAHQPSWDPR